MGVRDHESDGLSRAWNFGPLKVLVNTDYNPHTPIV